MNANKNNKYTRKDRVDLGDIVSTGHKPPQAIDVEEVVLGSILLDASCIDVIAENLVPSIFYKPANRLICETIIRMYHNNITIDLVTVAQELKSAGTLEEVGGVYYISRLTDRVGSTANIEVHVKYLQQYALKRSLLAVCSETIQKSWDETSDVFDLYAETQTAIEEAMKGVLHYEAKSICDVHLINVRAIISAQEKGGVAGVKTGLRVVDSFTNGWQPSDLIILAGRPGMGKTAIALTMAINPAIQDNDAIAIFSLEMSKEQLVGRVQSSLSKIQASKIIKKQITPDELQEIGKACKPLESAKVYIDDTPNISLTELKAKSRKLVKDKGVKLVVIDYLQLMRSGLNVANREQEIAEISKGLKALAKELKIPVIALSQLSRSVEGRTDKKPMLSDLRESGQIEQDADIVMFCYRPEYYGIDTYETDGENFNAENLFVLVIAKHRNGGIGDIMLSFNKELITITDYEEKLPNAVAYNPNTPGLQPNYSDVNIGRFADKGLVDPF